MNPGNFDRLVDIERGTNTNTNGSVSKTWAAVYSNIPVWKRPLDGDEILNADRFEAIQRTVFQTPYFDGILRTDRINDGTYYWNIESITEIGRKAGWRIVARVNESQ